MQFYKKSEGRTIYVDKAAETVKHVLAKGGYVRLDPSVEVSWYMCSEQDWYIVLSIIWYVHPQNTGISCSAFNIVVIQPENAIVD